MSRVGRPPSCECGSCAKCERRAKARERYQNMTPEEKRAMIAARDPEKVKAADIARYRRDLPKRRAAMKEYADTPEGRAAHAEARARWADANPEKVAASQALNNAVRDGRVIKGRCEEAADGECDGRIEGHHDDYSKPLVVRWLCKRHHEREHHGEMAA